MVNVLSSLDELVSDGDVVSLIIVKSGVSFADLVLIVVRFVGSSAQLGLALVFQMHWQWILFLCEPLLMLL